jgi:uncharacterized protein (DUF885 family)
MSEGGGLYTEDVFWEVGFLADPRQRLWQLKHALWRAVRLIVDTGIHARGMPFDTAVDLLVDRVKLERPSAIGEITRSTTAPTQPSSYQLGGELIMQTREAYRARLGVRPRSPHEQPHGGRTPFNELPGGAASRLRGHSTTLRPPLQAPISY